MNAYYLDHGKILDGIFDSYLMSFYIKGYSRGFTIFDEELGTKLFTTRKSAEHAKAKCDLSRAVDKLKKDIMETKVFKFIGRIIK